MPEMDDAITLTDRLDELARKGAEFAIFAGFSFQSKTNWSCKIIMKADAGKVECEADAPTFNDAVGDCLSKFDRINSGLVRFDGPLIEHTTQSSGPTEEDEIPF